MSKILSRWWPAILLIAIFVVALCIRVIPIYSTVFSGDTVKFTTNDAYYYVHQVDNITQHYPNLSFIDPYLNYPKSMELGPMNFFIYFTGGIAWVLGGGAPSQHLIDMVCAWLPAILGALTVIPVYFIGKTLFNRGVGIIAASLIAILPGDLLGRTMLGVTDRDAIEVLLTALVMMFLILAVKSAKEKQLTFHRLNRQNLAVFKKPIIYSLLSGFTLGLSILTWRGSYIFAGIFLVYFIIQSILDYSDDESFSYLSFVGIVTFLVTLLIVAITSRSMLYSSVLVISLLVPCVFSGIAWLLRRWNTNSFFYFLSIVIIIGASVGILYAASPSLFQSITSQLAIFMPSQTELTIGEVGSIFFPGSVFTLNVLWGNFTTCVYIGLIALVVLIYLAFKRNRHDEIFLIVWTFILFLGAMDLRRLAAFFAVTLSLLTAYMIVIFYYVMHFVFNYLARKSNSDIKSRLQVFVGLKQPSPVQAEPVVVESTSDIDYYVTLGVPPNASHKTIKKAHAKLVYKYTSGGSLSDEDKVKLKQIERAYAMLADKQRRAAFDHSQSYAAAQKKHKTGAPKVSGFRLVNAIKAAVIGIIVFLIAFFPNISPMTTSINEVKTYAPTDAWCNSLVWLKDNSPEPFGDSNSYYNLYDDYFNFPESVYCTTAWWDYGYLILRIAHRIPNCDPGAGARKLVARLFLSKDESSAYKSANNLNSKYIILDDSTVTEMWYAVASYAGSDLSNFTEVYYVMNEGQMTPVRCYYPEYYQSLAVRLYLYNGDAVTPTTLLVINYADKVTPSGIAYKEITSSKSFNKYKEAADYVAQQTTGNYRIVSTDASLSPVPLERLDRYQLVYSSDQQSSIYTDLGIPVVKIFEYSEE
jgi:oligosaccharyl transferase (archaeosortase A-associated)